MVRAEFLDRGLREAGYKTALFGKWHLGAGDPFEPTQQGFDSFLGHRGGFIDNYCHYFLHGKGFHDLYEGKREVFREGDYFPDMVTDRALEFIEKNQDNPCFLYLAFNIPHYPDQAITAMDWMPTMLRLCGVQRPDLQFDGHDILPVVQEDGPSPNTVMHWQWVSLWAVREGDWKLVQNRNVPLALYNLADEKPEQEDYMETHPAIASRLQAQHDEWLKEVMPEPDRTLFSLPENNAAGLVVRNAKRPNDAKVDQIAGTLFECGDAEDRVALYMEKKHLCFAVTAEGKIKILRSPNALLPTMWYAITAEVGADGRMYLVVRNQDPVHMPGAAAVCCSPTPTSTRQSACRSA